MTKIRLKAGFKEVYVEKFHIVSTMGKQLIQQ